MEIEKIAIVRTDFKTKFGIPRQSQTVARLEGTIIFEPKYRNPDTLRGLEHFSHFWIVWGFSENEGAKYNATVRPPKLGGNTRMGVFATRSPFRPNGLGLSLVKLDKIEKNDKYGHILHVLGVDMVDKTPIYDIKPYLPNADCAPDATGGFADEIGDYKLEVIADEKTLALLPQKKREILVEILAEDPRPAYIDDSERIYGFPFADCEIKFKVENKTLTVLSIEKI